VLSPGSDPRETPLAGIRTSGFPVLRRTRDGRPPTSAPAKAALFRDRRGRKPRVSGFRPAPRRGAPRRSTFTAGLKLCGSEPQSSSAGRASGGPNADLVARAEQWTAWAPITDTHLHRAPVAAPGPRRPASGLSRPRFARQRISVDEQVTAT
jgi:hypothetical protein